MTTENALLFIDSNIYLNLYRQCEGQRLLAPLRQQANNIFVTRQIVDEVNRNKVKVTAAFLEGNFKKLGLRTHGVPDHLFGVTEEQTRKIREGMKKAHKDINQINEEVQTLATNILDKVSKSNDEVSLTLQPIFDEARAHTELEMRQAKARKERGNPPGKWLNAIGDELNWEQILTRARNIGGLQLWIIAKDSDYGEFYNDRGYLNQFLYDELVRVSPGAEVFFFQHVFDGITHFAERTGANADALPTAEQARAIKEEAEALVPLDLITASNTYPMLDWITADNSATIRAIAGRSKAAFVANVLSPELSSTPTSLMREDQRSTASPQADGRVR